MNAIDTNVLVRIIVQDDEVQSKKALSYIKKQGSVFVGHIVLCEFSWVCMSCYDFKKTELSEVLENILRTEQLEIENSEVVWTALHEYKHSNADFSDCLIGANAKHHECKTVATFDKKASNSTFFELIK